MKDSVGKWVSSFTIPLVLSSNAFLARILANENAETFCSVGCGISIFTVEEGVIIVGIITATSGSFS